MVLLQLGTLLKLGLMCFSTTYSNGVDRIASLGEVNDLVVIVLTEPYASLVEESHWVWWQEQSVMSGTEIKRLVPSGHISSVVFSRKFEGRQQEQYS